MARGASLARILLCFVVTGGALRQDYEQYDEFELETQTLSQAEEVQDSTTEAKCADVEPEDCKTMWDWKGQAMCTKTYTGSVDEDPDARGWRINRGKCKEASRKHYQYGAKAYAAGLKGQGGCCAKTCGLCQETPPAATPTRTTPTRTAPTRTSATSTPTWTHWCREWQDVMGAASDSCKDENEGLFFAEVQGKRKGKSEISGQGIDGWCCWPPEPRFAAPSGPCATIRNYYPGGADCEQDFTCPKKYLITGNAKPIDIAPSQPCPNAR